MFHMFSMLPLPKEIVLDVLLRLDVKDNVSSSLVCKKFYEILHGDFYRTRWKHTELLQQLHKEKDINKRILPKEGNIC